MVQSEAFDEEMLSHVGAVGFYFLFIVGVLIPWAAFRSRRKLAGDAPLPPKSRFLRSAILVQVFLAGFAVWTASNEWIDLLPRAIPRLVDVGAGLAFLAVAILVMRPRWKRAVEKGDRRLHLFTPVTRIERVLWIALSLCAGIGEELSYRGVMAILLERLTASAFLAALLAAACFGLAHIVQGWKSAGVVTVFALGFHALAALTGALYVGMAVHFVYDVVAGLTYGRLAKERGRDVGSIDVEATARSGLE